MKAAMFVSIKGGVGKTLFADELAYALDRLGVPYEFAILDEQMTAGHEDHRADGVPEAVIVDTPAGMGEKAVAYLKDLEKDDLVVIVCRPTAKDIHTLEQTLRTVENATDARRLYVINQWRRGTRMPQEFLDTYFLTHVTDNADDFVIVPESTLVQQAEGLGESVAVYAKNKPAGIAVGEFVDKALAKLGIKKPKHRN